MSSPSRSQVQAFDPHARTVFSHAFDASPQTSEQGPSAQVIVAVLQLSVSAHTISHGYAAGQVMSAAWHPLSPEQSTRHGSPGGHSIVSSLQASFQLQSITQTPATRFPPGHTVETEEGALPHPPPLLEPDVVEADADCDAEADTDWDVDTATDSDADPDSDPDTELVIEAFPAVWPAPPSPSSSESMRAEHPTTTPDRSVSMMSTTRFFMGSEVGLGGDAAPRLGLRRRLRSARGGQLLFR